MSKQPLSTSSLLPAPYVSLGSFPEPLPPVSPCAAGQSLLGGGFYVGLLAPLAHAVWWRLLCTSLGTESAFCSVEACVHVSQLPASTLWAGLRLVSCSWVEKCSPLCILPSGPLICMAIWGSASSPCSCLWRISQCMKTFPPSQLSPSGHKAPFLKFSLAHTF